MFNDIIRALRGIIHGFSNRDTNTITSFELKQIPLAARSSARIATAEKDKELIDIVAEISEKAGLKKTPKVILYKDNSPNAFWHNNGSGGTIFIRTSTLEILSHDELKSCLAHEITHSFHKITNTFVPLAASTLALSSAAGLTYATYKKMAPDKKISPLSILTGALLLELGYDASKAVIRIFTRKISRELEYDADRGALLLTGNLEAMKSEFAKYDKSDQELREKRKQSIPSTTPTTENTQPPHNKSLAEKNNEPTGLKKVFKDLYASHPTPEQRIAHLEQVKKQMDAGALNGARPSRFF